MKDLKTKWNQHLAEARKKEEHFSKPEMRNTKEAKQHYRRIGFFLLIIGLTFTFINYLSIVNTGSVLIISIAVMIFLVPLGLWLIVFGKIPRWLAWLSRKMKNLHNI